MALVRNRPVILALAAIFGVLVAVGGYLVWYSKGYSYLSDDPSACGNCHVMRDNLDAWAVSAHRMVTCDGCHLPHDPIGKYAAQAEDGFRHSAAFTFENVQVIQIRAASLDVVQANCIQCHEATVSLLLAYGSDDVDCARCHRNVGHLT